MGKSLCDRVYKLYIAALKSVCEKEDTIGYRSDVFEYARSTGIAEPLTCGTDLSETEKAEVLSLLTHADAPCKDETQGAEVWSWESITWYESESHYVQEVRFVADTTQDAPKEAFCCIRISEDCEVTDVQGAFWDKPFDMPMEL